MNRAENGAVPDGKGDDDIVDDDGGGVNNLLAMFSRLAGTNAEQKFMFAAAHVTHTEMIAVAVTISCIVNDCLTLILFFVLLIFSEGSPCHESDGNIDDDVSSDGVNDDCVDVSITSTMFICGILRFIFIFVANVPTHQVMVWV
jgi:hypothetical protein